MAGKILIVEDHEDCREILKIQIQALGYEVIEATDGEEGVKKALTEAPDLVIMDLGLPGMDGIETTFKLRQNQKTTHLPVVAYTAWGAEFQEKAQKAGIVTYLTKPSEPRMVKEIIQKVLQTPS